MSVFRPAELDIAEGMIELRQYRSGFVAKMVDLVLLRVDHLVYRASDMSANSSRRICRRVTLMPLSRANVIKLSFVILGRIALLRGVRYSIRKLSSFNFPASFNFKLSTFNFLIPIKFAALHSSIYRWYLASRKRQSIPCACAGSVARKDEA